MRSPLPLSLALHQCAHVPSDVQEREGENVEGQERQSQEEQHEVPASMCASVAIVLAGSRVVVAAALLFCCSALVVAFCFEYAA